MFHNMAAVDYRRRQVLWESYSAMKAVIVRSVPLTLVLPDSLQKCPNLMKEAVDSVTTCHVNSVLVKLQLYQSLWLHLPNWAKTFTVNRITPAAQPFSKKEHLWCFINLVLNGEASCWDGQKTFVAPGHAACSHRGSLAEQQAFDSLNCRTSSSLSAGNLRRESRPPTCWFGIPNEPYPVQTNTSADKTKKKKNNNMKSLFNRFRRQYKLKSCNYTPDWLPPTE